MALSIELTDTYWLWVLLKRFPICINLFVLLFLVTPCLAVAVQPCVGDKFLVPLKVNAWSQYFSPIPSCFNFNKGLWRDTLSNESKISGKTPFAHNEVATKHSFVSRAWVIMNYNPRFPSRNHSFSMYAKFSEGITFLPPDTHTYRCVSGDKKCYAFGKFCVRTKWMIPNNITMYHSILLILPFTWFRDF